MKIDITGRPNPAYDPATILADMQKAIAFFSNVIRTDLPTDLFLDDLTLSEGGTGVQVIIEEVDGNHIIFVGKTVCYPGVRTFSNGDPGYPDDYDFVEKDTFTVDKKNDAIACMIGMIAVELFNQAGEAAAEQKFFEDLEAERAAANAGESWSFEY